MLSNSIILYMPRCFAICVMLIVIASGGVGAQSNNTPESRVRDFYTWYLKAKVSNKNPAKNKTVMNYHVSKRFSRWFYSRSVKDLESGVFFNSGDWKAAWADNIEASEAYFLTQNKAIVNIKLSSPPDDFVRLQVTLIKEVGKWKIDLVRSLFD